MGIQEDFYGKEGIKKLKELPESAGMCMFATHLDKIPL
jgi:hypothetical protein